MIRLGGEPYGGRGDTQFRGLVYPDGDELSKHMVARLESEPFYQSDKLFHALDIVKGRTAAIDCGAWVGGWSRELGKHFKRVIAVEANPNNARCAAMNVPENVEVICTAVSDENGRTFVAPENDGPNVGTRVVADQSGAVVPMRRIDDIGQVKALTALDYIKVHVNGMELKALRGAVDTILRFRPVLTVVLKPAIKAFGDSAEEARAFLSNELGYRAAGGERPYEIWCP